MRHTIIAALGAAVLGAALGTAPAPASAEGVRAPDLTRVYPNESYSQYYWYRGRRYWRGYGPGPAAAGVIGGLAAGALIGGAIASQGAVAQPLPKTQDPDFIAYCSRKYRTFDPVDGTYLARDGGRYMCEYP
jgi:BA14K-like protein